MNSARLASPTMTTCLPLAAALILGACTTVAEAPGGLPPGSRYVAMGSSFAAGPKLGAPKPNTPERCARDQGNYPTLLAQRLNLDLVDASCSGATTAHILGPWNELPAQLDALTPETRLVTITIGGNDVNYVSNLYIAAMCHQNTSEPRCASMPTPSEADWARLETNLRQIVREARARAPKARIVFVDYVTMLGSGATCTGTAMSPERTAAMQALAARLQSLTERTARENGAEVFEASALSRSHTACDSEPWSMGGPGSGSGAPWHPNAAGHAAIAEALAARLKAN